MRRGGKRYGGRKGYGNKFHGREGKMHRGKGHRYNRDERRHGRRHGRKRHHKRFVQRLFKAAKEDPKFYSSLAGCILKAVSVCCVAIILAIAYMFYKKLNILNGTAQANSNGH